MKFGTFIGEAVTSCLLCVWFPLCLGDHCRLILSLPEFSCYPCPTSTSCLVAPPILPAWLLAIQHFIKQIEETKLYRVKSLSHSTLGTDIKGKVGNTTSINNSKQGTYPNVLNTHSIPRSLQLVLKMAWLDYKRMLTTTDYLIFNPMEGLRREIALLEWAESTIKQLPKCVVHDRDNRLSEQSSKVSFAMLKQPTLSKA